jgi:hypothetical protein
MKHLLTLATMMASGVAALALTATLDFPSADQHEASAALSTRLPEPSQIYRDHINALRHQRATVVPASYVTFVPVGDDEDVDAGVLLKNPSDYEGLKLARLIGVQMAPVESCAKELKAHNGTPIAEVVK